MKVYLHGTIWRKNFEHSVHSVFVHIAFESYNEDLLNHFIEIRGLIFNELICK